MGVFFSDFGLKSAQNGTSQISNQQQVAFLNTNSGVIFFLQKRNLFQAINEKVVLFHQISSSKTPKNGASQISNQQQVAFLNTDFDVKF